MSGYNLLTGGYYTPPDTLIGFDTPAGVYLSGDLAAPVIPKPLARGNGTTGATIVAAVAAVPGTGNGRFRPGYTSR